MKCSWGSVELKDGGGEPKELILEVTTGDMAPAEIQYSWSYLTKSQAKNLAERLLKFVNKK
jgi:hypothetical protein